MSEFSGARGACGAVPPNPAAFYFIGRSAEMRDVFSLARRWLVPRSFCKPLGCERVTSCRRVVPRRCDLARADLWVLRGVARLLVGGSIRYPVNPTPTSNGTSRGKERFGLTLTPAVCAGADFAPNCFSNPFLFPLGFNLSKSQVESESAPASAATAHRHGHCWVVKKAIDLPLDGI